MKIVHVEDFFHPDAGYQINILPKYLSQFGHDNTIVTSEMKQIPNSLTSFFGKDDIAKKDEEYTRLTNVQIVRLPLKGFISGRAIFRNDLFQTIEELNPDVLYIHGNDTLTAMRILNRRRKIDIPLIFDSHMLEMASQNKFSRLFHWFYKLFYTPIIRKNNYNVIRTQDDNFVEKHLGIPLSQAPWISYGSDTLLFHPNYEAKGQFKRLNSICDDDFVVLYAGKIDESKGGKLLANAFLKKFNTEKNIVLICVGSAVDDYGKEVNDIFARSQNRIIQFPTQKYRDLSNFFQVADLCVFPKQCSLSFYDAQACGIPVLSEDNNINVDRCSHGNGWNFVSGDVEDLRKKVEFVANMSKEEYLSYSNAAYRFITENYNYEDKAREYEKIIIDTFHFKDLK